ncbi:RES family NAD+ phosphorylase [Parafrankia discariae]|uniref:RES family NAD+ phosphorylase n=1 Tax=Parafrankia discariae TaxID=365528 RepID=UPI00036B74F6|nr:RES family NAD+ phosphorylase [Parafrankia discariae]
MPRYLPRGCDGVPNREIIPVGTTLWRVHGSHRRVDEFNRTANDRHVGGGRFSGTEDCPYPYLYLALSEDTALVEVLLRAIPFGGPRRRLVPRAAVAGRRLSAVTVTAPVVLLRLISSPDLAAVCQDEWLVHADPPDYGLTRRWAHWLHEHHPWAQGLIWHSRRNLGEPTTMLFGDRCQGVLRGSPARFTDLADAAALGWLNNRLGPFGAQVSAPAVLASHPAAAQ